MKQENQLLNEFTSQLWKDIGIMPGRESSATRTIVAFITVIVSLITTAYEATSTVYGLREKHHEADV